MRVGFKSSPCAELYGYYLEIIPHNGLVVAYSEAKPRFLVACVVSQSNRYRHIRTVTSGRGHAEAHALSIISWIVQLHKLGAVVSLECNFWENKNVISTEENGASARN